MPLQLLATADEPQFRPDANMTEAQVRSAEPVRRLHLDLVDPSPWQRRIHFDEHELRAMAESFGHDGSGLVQPPIVRPMPTGRYELVAGERRVRAARLAGLRELPFVVRALGDLEARQARAIENIEREDELAWETAQSYEDLLCVARLLRKNAGAGIVARLGRRHGRSAVSQYLRVARQLPRKLMMRADALRPDVLPELTLEILYPIARLSTVSERYAALQAVVRQIRARENTEALTAESAAACASDADAPATRAGSRRRTSARERSFSSVMNGGGFRKTVRPPVRSLSAEQASAHLADLLPMIAALGAQTMGAGGWVQLLDVSGSPVEVWLITKSAHVTAHRDRLVASVPALRQLRARIDTLLQRAEAVQPRSTT